MSKRGTLTEKAETRITKQLSRRLKERAQREQRSDAAVIRRALEAYLEEKVA